MRKTRHVLCKVLYQLLSRAREGRGISVAPEAQMEPEQEIVTSEEGLGAARPFPFPTDTGSFFYICRNSYCPYMSGSNRNQCDVPTTIMLFDCVFVYVTD